jgi:hypothetical protein
VFLNWTNLNFDTHYFFYTLAGPLKQGRSISWIKRLEIAEDAAKGL